MVRLAAVCVICLLAAAPCGAGTLDAVSGQPARPLGDGTALAELQPLAAQGNAEAQYRLANLYRDGQGVPRDETAAADWYRRAAEGGVWDAAFQLGMLYWSHSQAAAVSAPDDGLVRAHMWLGIAAATERAGCVDIGAPLRDAIAQTMTREQVARSHALARAWLAEHRPVGDAKIIAADKPGC